MKNIDANYYRDIAVLVDELSSFMKHSCQILCWEPIQHQWELTNPAASVVDRLSGSTNTVPGASINTKGLANPASRRNMQGPNFLPCAPGNPASQFNRGAPMTLDSVRKMLENLNAVSPTPSKQSTDREKKASEASDKKDSLPRSTSQVQEEENKLIPELAQIKKFLETMENNPVIVPQRSSKLCYPIDFQKKMLEYIFNAPTMAESKDRTLVL